MSNASRFAKLLNHLVDMQDSPTYILRKPILFEAEHVIVKLEEENEALKQKLKEYESREPVAYLGLNGQDKQITIAKSVLDESEPWLKQAWLDALPLYK